MTKGTTFTTTVLTFMLTISATCSQQADVVQTTLGPVQGLRQTVMGQDYDVYWGIPFAKPPVGDLRFKHPQSADPWDGILSADTRPNSCYQFIPPYVDNVPALEGLKPNTLMSEDCLYLNVWVPRVAGSPSPRTTMVWIYGGGFQFGSSAVDLYDGAKLAVTENVIVASMNYRLDALGFLYTGTADAPGNQGLVDQTLALKWIYDNIVGFGGRQDSITIFGNSAGSISVGLHLVSPLSMTYFTRAIMQSGVPTDGNTILTPSTAAQGAHKLSEVLGCPQDSIPTMVQCLRWFSAEDVISFAHSSSATTFINPVVDGHFLPKDVNELLSRGEVKDTQILIGVNKDEGFFFFSKIIPNLPLNLNDGDLTKEELKQIVRTIFRDEDEAEAIMLLYVDGVPPPERDLNRDVADAILGDYLFVCPTRDFVTAFTSLNGQRDVYLYLFQHRLSSSQWPQWVGTAHLDDIGPVFGLPLEFNYTQPERDMARRMTGYWTQFAETGNPNNANVTLWPKYMSAGGSYLKITVDGDSVEHHLRYQQCSFLYTILPLLRQLKPDICPQILQHLLRSLFPTLVFN